jgi:hypothetical protein
MNKDFPQSFIFEELASELIGSGCGFRFQARGRSMLPTIEDGEILHVAPVETERLKVGDIVLMRTSEGFKAHRIVGRMGSRFVVRGDAGEGHGETVARDQILGLVVSKECRATGRIVRLRGLMPRLIFSVREAKSQFSSVFKSHG